MSGSEQNDHMALVSVDDQAIIGGIVNRNLMEIDFAERQAILESAQAVRRRVAQYTEPAAMVQRVCNHQNQIIVLQKQITDLQTQQFLRPECDDSMFEQQLEILRQEPEEARRIPRTVGTDKDVRQELDNDMGRQTIGRKSPSCEDAARQCAILSSPGSPDSTPATQRQRTEVSGLPGRFRIRSRSVERLDSSDPNGHMTQSRQLSPRAVEDVVRIQSPQGSGLRPDFTTRPGRWRDKAGRPTRVHRTPGSSVWGPQPSSHRRTKDAGDETKQLRVLLVRC